MPASVGLKLTEAFGANVVLYKPFEKDELIEAIVQAGVASPAKQP